ncbi:hypothetical protein TUM4637_09270 [Shewanella hafniensis]|uniref:hypothetical protein n=1 Tax=Shewanella TaxID=22 RepID=UPI0001883D69|nr:MULTISPECIES: hypothetical protein [Shewanella]ACK45315.1 conserved hypothetical protein [Shewanella baltica OS223]MCL1135401.1 DUF4258 domain-containing protein [Shewanella hafniensis]MCS6205222.1 DUF4258 domain-containing protein [Shewanella baltica]GIU24699.1 hypothetical protein TUM4637_09270 [Shewanella hafniensis]
MQFYISRAVRQKLHEKHQVSDKEIFECFFNRTHSFLTDTREDHLTDPITKWFISETDLGRQLKVCFIERGVESIEIKTAYEPSTTNAINVYYKIAKEC